MAQKPHTTILEQEIEQGQEELERSSRGLFLSGLSAGLDIGFSALLLGAVVTVTDGNVNPALAAVLKANAYTIGFIVVVFGRSALFTEYTTLVALPVLARRAPLSHLARVWAVVYCANLIGAAAFAAVLSWLGPALHVAEAKALESIAANLTRHPLQAVLVSAVIAGWMMGLVSWLVTAGRDTVGQIIFVWLVTSTIGFCGLHHSIVGSVEVLTAVFAGTSITLPDFFRFLWASTLGNAFGGVIFVALLKFAHVRAGNSERHPRRHRADPNEQPESTLES